MTELLVFIGGLLAGGLVAWQIARGRALTRAASERSALETRVGAAESAASELRTQITQREQEVADLRRTLQDEQQSRVAANTRLDESLKNVAAQKKLLDEAGEKFRDAFAALSADALRKNSEAFAAQTAEKVRPLREALQRYEVQIAAVEKIRQEAYGGVKQQLQALGTTHQQLSRETANLIYALRDPQVKGRWGELHLRRTVEAAGLSGHCDFVEQFSVQTEEGRKRPDLIVKLPGDRTIVIDAKVSTDAYLDAAAERDPSKQAEHLARYVRAIRTHIQDLSRKAYWEQFERSPDFVVMFMPGESFFSAALEQDRDLIEDAMRNRVILASPTTLIALLRTVAYSWQQQELLENAAEIGQTAKDLFERVCKFAEHLGKVGEGLRRATDSYNASVASWERRVVPMGRRMTELGVVPKDQTLTELPPVDATPRSLPPLVVQQRSQERLSAESNMESP